MIDDVLFRCEACDFPATAKAVVMSHRIDEACVDGAGVPLTTRIALTTDLPAGWRRSYGASGRGNYHICAECVKRDVRIDDTSWRKVICYGDSMEFTEE